MQRRRLLKVTAVSATVLALTGGTIALLKPAIEAGRLTSDARAVFSAVGGAVLEGSLPADPRMQSAAVEALLQRVEGLIAQLPPHAQEELSSLLALLASHAGRLAFAGLGALWAAATTMEIQASLQAMRTSRFSLRRQAYQALHDVIVGAYFSDPGSWPLLGYPGPGVAFS